MLTHELYPEAREIFLVRDFRDMVCSVLAFNEKRGYQAFWRELVDTDEEYVTRIVRVRLMELYRQWQARADRTCLVRYEDLVQRPLEVLPEILAYLGLDGGSEVAEKMLAAAAVETPELRDHRTAPDAAASIGRWRRDLTPELQAVCRRELGDLLEAFGYR